MWQQHNSHSLRSSRYSLFSAPLSLVHLPIWHQRRRIFWQKCNFWKSAVPMQAGKYLIWFEVQRRTGQMSAFSSLCIAVPALSREMWGRIRWIWRIVLSWVFVSYPVWHCPTQWGGECEVQEMEDSPDAVSDQQLSCSKVLAFLAPARITVCSSFSLILVPRSTLACSALQRCWVHLGLSNGKVGGGAAQEVVHPNFLAPFLTLAQEVVMPNDLTPFQALVTPGPHQSTWSRLMPWVIKLVLPSINAS